MTDFKEALHPSLGVKKNICRKGSKSFFYMFLLSVICFPESPSLPAHQYTGPGPECISAPTDEQHGYQPSSSLLPSKFFPPILRPVRGRVF